MFFNNASKIKELEKEIAELKKQLKIAEEKTNLMLAHFGLEYRESFERVRKSKIAAQLKKARKPRSKSVVKNTTNVVKNTTKRKKVAF